MKHLFKWGAMFKVNNGKVCRFWEDCWAGNVPLRISHESLFRMVRDPGCSVSECWEEGKWVMDFRRALSVQEFESWKDLTNSLQDHCPVRDIHDSVCWALESKGNYTTKSLYRFMTDWGMPTCRVGWLDLFGDVKFL